jgi:hypothetical protein
LGLLLGTTLTVGFGMNATLSKIELRDITLGDLASLVLLLGLSAFFSV